MAKGLKILYAAGNNSNGKIQLSRFLQAIDGEDYQVKVAAFKKSSPIRTNIDFTLDCINNIFTDTEKEPNEYLDRYWKLVKMFDPDLVISDLEFYSSEVAFDLGIPVWQCSSAMINYGLNFAWNERREYQDALKALNRYVEIRREKEILKKSLSNYVYSHFGDLKDRPDLKTNFQWVRPYHFLGEDYEPCRKNLVAAILNKNRKLLSFLRGVNDAILFTDFSLPDYGKMMSKRIEDVEEYACNLKNCRLFLCEGQTTILSDAYYNGKFPLVIPAQFDLECISNGWMTEKMELGRILFRVEDFEKMEMKEVQPNYRSDVQYLHQKLEML